MERKTDLRVIKTKKRIKQVFMELLEKKELKKITVTELAKTAEINKGTFYLHYKDIYELYAEVIRERIDECVTGISFISEFFDAPEAFIFHLYQAARDESSGICMNVLSAGSAENDTNSGMMIPKLIGNALKERIYSLDRIPRTEENDIRLDYIIFNLYFFLRSELSEKKYEILSEMIVSDIRSTFGAPPAN